MHGKLEQIVELAVDTERWPEILPHYRWVTLLEGGGDHKVVEMAARRGRIPVRWRATQDVDRSGPIPIIRFKHVWGVTKGMDVDWTFLPEEEQVKVRIRHDFNPNWPIVGAPISERIIGPQFITPIANLTLATIKGIVEGRDPRFPQ
jgi:ribosome-associated toxin RatA of RatAB toxin-antitoxin module